MLLNLAPGPDIAFVLGRTVAGGRRAGFAAMFGIWTGAFGHVLAAAVGLSAILATSALACSLVKWAGAAYLIWLGIQALRSGGGRLVGDTEKRAENLPAVFRQAMLIPALNPKVAIFFLAFLPQFVVPGAGPVPAQLFLRGLLIIVTAAFIEPVLVIAGDRLTAALRSRPRLGAWLDRVLGGMLVALGVKLTSSKL